MSKYIIKYDNKNNSSGNNKYYQKGIKILSGVLLFCHKIFLFNEWYKIKNAKVEYDINNLKNDIF